MTERASLPDKLTFLLALVPYALQMRSISVSQAAAHFSVQPAFVRTCAKLIGVSGVPGETGTYLPGDLFDIDWDALERDDELVITHSVVIDRAQRFTAAELAALLTGLSYLETVLPDHEARAASALAAKLAALQPQRTPVGSSADPAHTTLSLVTAAIEDGAVLDFDYVNAQGSSRRRSAAPQQVLKNEGIWYLRGWNEPGTGTSDDARTFRIDRMSQIVRSTAARSEHALSSSVAQPAQPIETVTLDVSPAALDFLTWFHSTNELAAGPATVHVSNTMALARAVAAHPGTVIVTSPSSVRALIADRAAAALARYGL